MPAGLHDPPGIELMVLKELGIKPTAAKVSFLRYWFSHEGNNSGGANGQNNPLNVQGANPVPYNYPTPQAGAKATADVLRQSNFAGILRQLRMPNSTPLQLAAAVTNSPWASSHYGATKTPGGGYVGGSLVGGLLGPAVKQPGLGTAIGDVGHYIAHPISGVQKTGTAAEQAVKKPLTDTLHYVLYGLAIAGGGALAIVGLILIAADIGLSKNRRIGDLGGRAVGSLRGPSDEERDAADRREAEAIYREHRNSEQEAKARNARARAEVSEGKARVIRERKKRDAEEPIPF